MPNSYFQFKKFVINQEHCAMKVCTDACVFGAWFAQKVSPYTTILDIGSGTGLLMLMLAQKTQGVIHGIEIDLTCFRQLKDNILQSPWHSRLQVFPGDVRSYHFNPQYDFIICNPPFFDKDLPSESVGEQIAKHSKHLSFEELLNVIDRNLTAAGNFSILLPAHRKNAFEELASRYRFYPREHLQLRHSATHEPFRSIIQFVRHKEEFSPTYDLVIKQADGSYTEEFRELLKDYYLHL